MSLVVEVPPPTRKQKSRTSWLLILALFIYLVLLPAVRYMEVRIPHTSYVLCAYAIYKQNGSPWPWTPDPNQGFSRQTRGIVSFQAHEAYILRIGPLVYEWQRDPWR